MRGIDMSSRTTSGCSSAVASTPALAVGGLADDLDRRVVGQRRAHQRPEALGVVAQQNTDRIGGSHVLHIIGW